MALTESTDEVVDLRNSTATPTNQANSTLLQETKQKSPKHALLGMVILTTIIVLIIVIWFTLLRSPAPTSGVKALPGYKIIQSSSTPPRMEKLNNQ